MINSSEGHAKRVASVVTGTIWALFTRCDSEGSINIMMRSYPDRSLDSIILLEKGGRGK